jgi:carbonic anhydrase
MLFGSLKQSVKDDVEFLKTSSYIGKEVRVHGFVFDLLESGQLIPV